MSRALLPHLRLTLALALASSGCVVVHERDADVDGSCPPTLPFASCYARTADEHVCEESFLVCVDGVWRCPDDECWCLIDQRPSPRCECRAQGWSCP